MNAQEIQEIIEQFYPPGSGLYDIFMAHARFVAQKSQQIARSLMPRANPDLSFIEQAAMLHDIGIVRTRSKSLGCTGEYPYICHGYLGRQMLDACGLDPRYGLVCERHTGAGITLDNIITNRLPLPHRDMVPRSLEEKIICVADKFHSKDPEKQREPLTKETIIQKLSAIDPGHGQRFAEWADAFGL